MTALDWRPLAGVDLTRLQEARLQAHYAMQWLARVAQAFVTPKLDESHMTFSWEDAYGGFATHKLQGARIGLKLFPLSLATLEGKNNEQGRVLVLDGQKDTDVRNWFGETAHSLGLDARGLDKALSYKISPHRIATGSPYLVREFGQIDRTHCGGNAPEQVRSLHDPLLAAVFRSQCADHRAGGKGGD
jgi:hypothetical protein